MLMSDNTRQQLHDLQAYVAKTYTIAIDQMHETGEFNAAVLNGARQLLKDNDVVTVSDTGTPLGNLANVLPFDDDDKTKEAIRQG
jgi:hypothetical protein|tara:strand:+ start:293 stop:547 length:255 start_codon:yes stop_codon:yes gene_type:complete